LCEQRETRTERSKNSHEQSGERESKKSSAAERSAEWEVAERAGAVSEDHRNGNAEWQNSPLRSAPMLCTGVIESVVRRQRPIYSF